MTEHLTEEQRDVLYLIAIGKNISQMSEKLNRRKKEIKEICATLRDEYYAKHTSQLTAQFGGMLYERNKVAYHLATGVPFPERKELPRGKV